MQGAHLAAAGFVHDLAGLAVPIERGLGRLARGQIGQHALGQRRIQPQHLPRRNDAVAAERGREPRRACIGIGSGRQVGRQQRHVGARLVQPVVEARAARAAHRGAAPAFGAHGQAGLDGVLAPAVGVRRFAGVHAAFDEEVQRAALGQAEHELGALMRQAGGRFGKGDAAGPVHVVQTAVAEGDATTIGGRRVDGAALGPRRAAHLEDVEEVRAEVEGQRQQDVLHPMVDHADALEHPPVPQKPPALDMHDAGGRRTAAHRGQGTVGGVAGEEDVVLADAGRQTRRLQQTDRHGPARQDAGVAREQAVGAALHVAPAVGDQEGIAFLQRHQLFETRGLDRFTGGQLSGIGVVHAVSSPSL